MFLFTSILVRYDHQLRRVPLDYERILYHKIVRLENFVYFYSINSLTKSYCKDYIHDNDCHKLYPNNVQHP